MKLNEDDLYRSSTQFRNWSFTAAQLDAQRQTVNLQATERVKANVARIRAQRAQDAIDNDGVGSGVEKENGSGTSGANTPNAGSMQTATEVNCLTAEEEMKIVDEFCERAIALGNHYSFPLNVVSTAIQYLRRFYLFNSPMTYHVNTILRTTMFLATKIELFNIHVSEYAQGAGRNVTTESILAPEYIIMLGLRYNLDIRHPYRALKAGHMEMLEMCHGKYLGPAQGLSAKEVQAKISQLPLKPGGQGVKMPEKKVEERIHNAYAVTANTLRTIAVLTDAYFLYTPSQIWLSAHLLADEPLTLFYLSCKLPTTSPLYAKLLATLRSCAQLISTHRLYTNTTLPKDEKEQREKKHQAEVKHLVQKLKNCRDPDKVDLVKLNQAQKRDAVEGANGEQLEESKAKRRKLAREGYEKEADAFWGPELGKPEAK